MEYTNVKQVEYNSKHIAPLFSALDSLYKGSAIFSSCERPCVCVCICRHGTSASLDFSGKKDLEKKTEDLFRESLAP